MKFADYTYEQLINEKQTLSTKLEILQDSCAKEGLEYEKFCEKAKQMKEDLYFIEKYIRFNEHSPEIVKLTDEEKGAGKLIKMDDFIKLAKKKVINDFSGIGRYATVNIISTINILPSDILEDIYRKDFTHVIWREFEK